MAPRTKASQVPHTVQSYVIYVLPSGPPPNPMIQELLLLRSREIKLVTDRVEFKPRPREIKLVTDRVEFNTKRMLWKKKKKLFRVFPGGPVVKSLLANPGDTGSTPGPGGSYMSCRS